jgi:hypothetical protein
VNTEIVNSRTGVGAGIGAFLGFLFGGPLGAGVGAVVGGGIAHASGGTNRGVLTAQRQIIFERAMESIKDPNELKKLADAYAHEGLGVQADLLRKRAALRDLPADTKEQRRVAFRKAMAADDADVILKIAAAFEAEGALDAAKTLRAHGVAVQAAHAAGKSAKPTAGGTQAQFADKLAKAIVHFGPESGQAKSAASNLVSARGKTPTEALIAEVIKISADALRVAAPASSGPPNKPIQVAEAPKEVEATIEPTAVGPAAPAIEPPAEVEAAGDSAGDDGTDDEADDGAGGVADDGAGDEPPQGDAEEPQGDAEVQDTTEDAEAARLEQSPEVGVPA